MYSLNSKFQVPSIKIEGPALKRGQFYTLNPSLRGGEGAGGKRINIFQIYILCVTYIPSFSFLALKLGVEPSKGGNFTQKTLVTRGRGLGGGEEGKYFSNIYPMCNLNSEFQLPITKTVGRNSLPASLN